MNDTDRKAKIISIVLLVLRLILGVIFLYAGAVHFLEPKGFAEAAANYKVLPAVLVNPFSVVLPFIEVFTGAAMIFGIFISGSSLIISLMLFMFAIALSLALYHGLDISCGCFTTSKEAQSISWAYLLRDISLLLMSVFVFFFDTGYGSVARFIRTKDK